jgi:hypothetical protein
MLFALDLMAGRQRHEEMLREAEEYRLARKVAKQRGTASLLSRMVKLLSRSSRPAQTLERSEGPLNQQQLADANSR